jgi:hypothetical protein
VSTDEIDAIVTGTRRLPLVAPDPVWSDHLRARCRARIAPRARPTPRLPGPTARAEYILATAVVGSFSALYLLSVVYDVVRLYRVP